MKVRNGFVSNSSSSSFIVKFPCELTSPQQVKELVFGDEDFITERFWDGEQKFSTATMAEIIYRDATSQKRTQLDKKLHRYEFEFSDNDGRLFCVMEHGDIFHKFPYEYESHH